jgi:hypothetical protein
MFVFCSHASKSTPVAYITATITQSKDHRVHPWIYSGAPAFRGVSVTGGGRTLEINAAADAAAVTTQLISLAADSMRLQFWDYWNWNWILSLNFRMLWLRLYFMCWSMADEGDSGFNTGVPLTQLLVCMIWSMRDWHQTLSLVPSDHWPRPTTSWHTRSPCACRQLSSLDIRMPSRPPIPAARHRQLAYVSYIPNWRINFVFRGVNTACWWCNTYPVRREWEGVLHHAMACQRLLQYHNQR